MPISKAEPSAACSQLQDDAELAAAARCGAAASVSLAGKTAAPSATPGGWQVYADLKNTGVYAPGDPIATTDVGIFGL